MKVVGHFTLERSWFPPRGAELEEELLKKLRTLVIFGLLLV